MVDLKQGRILVVEDQKDGQQVLSDILAFYEMSCEVVGTAEDGLAQLKQDRYDAAIIDLGLPGMSGFELVAKIREETPNKTLPCVAYTAYHTSKVRHEALTAGFDAYLQKPVSQETLINTLRRVMDSPQRGKSYDDIAEEYIIWVRQHLADENSVLSLARSTLLNLVGDYHDLTICDLGCGEGYLTRHLEEKAGQVIGVDLSSKLLDQARKEAPPSDKIRYMEDDARSLSSLPNDSFDLVVSNLMLADIANLRAVMVSVRRVLKPTGQFVFSVPHPAFASPSASIVTDKGGQFASKQIVRYANEGRWISDNKAGIRGKVGAHHRTLATYLNTLVEAGFALKQVAEPTLPPAEYKDANTHAMTEIPPLLVVSAVAT